LISSNGAEKGHVTSPVKIIECPRDAWQGLRQIISTEEKVKYVSQLVKLGFRHIDAVSFVSPKHVPQMADSEAVMKQLSHVKLPSGESPEIIGIVVNAQGLDRALSAPGVTTIGYPYSISAYFRRANANMSRAESRDLVEKLQRETKAAGRNLVVYISMAFGNPYDEDVAHLYSAVKNCVAGVELGVHLHSRPERAAEKVLAAYESGCRRFDGALTGLGGCPFAGDDLVGNIPTEAVLTTLTARGVSTGIDTKSLAIACAMTHEFRERHAHAPEAAKPN
jgi:hydroxymethylglutaryl-CoA lyase